MPEAAAAAAALGGRRQLGGRLVSGVISEAMRRGARNAVAPVRLWLAPPSSLSVRAVMSWRHFESAGRAVFGVAPGVLNRGNPAGGGRPVGPPSPPLAEEGAGSPPSQGANA